jgi:hypothetical protein
MLVPNSRRPPLHHENRPDQNHGADNRHDQAYYAGAGNEQDEPHNQDCEAQYEGDSLGWGRELHAESIPHLRDPARRSAGPLDRVQVWPT